MASARGRPRAARRAAASPATTGSGAMSEPRRAGEGRKVRVIVGPAAAGRNAAVASPCGGRGEPVSCVPRPSGATALPPGGGVMGQTSEEYQDKDVLAQRAPAITILAAEALRGAANGARPGEPPPAKTEERISLFWRVFGGTLLSIAALL